MKDLNLDRNNFFKKGYCVVREVISPEKVEKYQKLIKNKSNELNAPVFEGIHNFKEFWDVIANEEILNILKKLLNNDNIKYLYSASARHESNYDSFPFSWHRDNVCRLFGIGPDWNLKETFNIIRVAIYLSPYEKVKSGLNVIPYSHKRRFTFSNILRIFHWRTKYSNNFFILKIRKIIEKIIGVNIKTDSGDCVFFIASLMHSGIPATEKCDTRNAIFLTFGTDNIHSENFVNYWLKHRSNEGVANNIPNQNNDALENFLKDNNIYMSLPKEKKFIQGVSIPKSKT